MGNLWIPDAPDWIRNAGLAVDEYPGHLTRSRSSGGFDDILGICVHHDAARATASLAARTGYEFLNAPFAPVGNAHFHFDAKTVWGASGAANTQGSGGPWKCSRGTIPLNAGNRYAIAFEASNDGVGQVWTNTQIANYPRLCAAMIVGLRDQGAYDAGRRQHRRITLDPLRDVFSHFEWAPTRKNDPSGPPSPFMQPGHPTQRWEMDVFRAAVAQQVAVLSGTTPPGGTPMSTISERWETFVKAERLYDSRPAEPAHHNPSVPKTKLRPGDPPRKIAVAMLDTAAEIRVTAVNVGAPKIGFVAISGRPDEGSPILNFRGLEPESGSATVAIPDGHIYLTTSHSPCDIVVDLRGVGLK